MARRRKLEAVPTADRSELRRLLEAAKADHWDDGPRLALADWLEENGGEADRARAEVIRLQLEADGGGVPWRLVVEKLRDRHVREWMPTNRDIFSHLLPVCERGLLVAVGPGSAWGDAAPDEAWQWVETARPSSIKMRDLPALVASPRLASVACLDLDTGRRGTVALGRLFDGPHLPRRLVFGCNADNLPFVARRLRPGLEGLDLWARAYPGSSRRSAWGDILRSDAAFGLRSLSMRGSSPEGADVPLVAALPLRHLRLEGRGLAAAELPALTGPHLRHLSIWHGDFPFTALPRLQDATCCDTLERLTLYRCLSGTEAVAFSLPRLRRLRLEFCSLTAAMLAALAEGGTFAGLDELVLSRNSALGEAGMAALTASVAEGPRKLDLAGCGLGDAGLRRLAGWRGLSRVRVLLLGNNDLTDAGLLALAESPHASGLEALGLDQNRRLTPRGIEAILRAPLGARLTWLSLTYLGGEGSSAVRFEASPPPRLRELHLGWHPRRARATGRLPAIRAAMPGCAVGE
jgi:uncharacterized protein (TIGR02996 family)